MRIGAMMAVGCVLALCAGPAMADSQTVAALTPADFAGGTSILDASSATPDVEVEFPAKKLFCVEYARLRSGLAIFGDAKLWWSRAKDLYARMTTPASDAVMVFSGSSRLKKGHVAVVTRVVGPREIIVDHANWQNKGEIDRNMPVLDVSKNNDWSKVRVWNVASNSYGSHVYAISGFITR